MSIHYCEIEFDCFLDRFFVTVEIKFEFVEGEETVRYYQNGHGYPGSGPSISIVGVQVTSLSNESWDKTLEELKASGFQEWLDEKALVAVGEEILGDSWLLCTLFEVASTD